MPRRRPVNQRTSPGLTSSRRVSASHARPSRHLWWGRLRWSVIINEPLYTLEPSVLFVRRATACARFAAWWAITNALVEPLYTLVLLELMAYVALRRYAHPPHLMQGGPGGSDPSRIRISVFVQQKRSGTRPLPVIPARLRTIP
jgi:hypothetical protein